MISKIKGTTDIFNKDANYELLVYNSLLQQAYLYNYKYIRTPIFEETILYHRSVGESSDIVSKETYDFTDRGGRNITLRPEGTAGIVRSYIENKMYGQLISPTKLFYFGPMYRYERPQAGRTREFLQFGVEILGSKEVITDAEVISFSYNYLLSLGLEGVKVKINSLGDASTRQRYQEALVKFFEPQIKNMCADCQARITKNPLRILDCKVDITDEIISKMPKISNYLSEESVSRFQEVLNILDTLKVNYEVCPNLVRGLDYYNETVFELEIDCPSLGRQNVVGGGGRYDSLVEQLGGPQTPCFGFAFGVSRITEALKMSEALLDTALDVYIIDEENKYSHQKIEIAQVLREVGFICDFDYSCKNMKAQYKQADEMNARYYVILNDLILDNKVIIKNAQTKEKEEVEIDYVTYYLGEQNSVMEEINEEDLF